MYLPLRLKMLTGLSTICQQSYQQSPLKTLYGMKWDKVGKFILILQLQNKKVQKWVTR